MIGERIAIRRRELGLSHSDLAKLLGGRISPQTIAAVEGRRRNPSVIMLVAIARALGVSNEYLLGLSEDKSDFPTSRTRASEQAIAQTFRGVPRA